METLTRHNSTYEKRKRDYERKIEDSLFRMRTRRRWAKVKCFLCNVEMYYDIGDEWRWEPRYYWEDHWKNPVKCPKCGHNSIKKDMTSDGDWHWK